MNLGFLKTIGLLLPTIILFGAVSYRSNIELIHHAEAFGAADYYLELLFNVNPRGILSEKNGAHVGFSGTFVHFDQKEEIRGALYKTGKTTIYEFESAQGHFKGQLIASQGKCEPTLDFNIESDGKTIDHGRLQASFCP